MDKHTVRLTLAAANSVLPDAFGQYFMNIVPVGYKSLKAGGKQIGTGPYTLQELHAGPALGAPAQPELLADGAAVLRPGHGHRHPRRQRAGERAARRPGGRDRSRSRSRRSPSTQGKGFKILNSAGGGWVPITMAVDQAPFTDVRVRQAFRLIADRPKLVAGRLLGLRPRRQGRLLAARRRVRHRAATARAGHRQGEVAAQGRGPEQPDARPADDRRPRRPGRVRDGVRADGEPGRRHDQRQDPRRRRPSTAAST